MSSNQKIPKTEKAAVNIGVIELAQIDVLVENLLYTNRSDFIRMAIRKQLECHRDYIDGMFPKIMEQDEKMAIKTMGGIGVFRLSASDLQSMQAQGKKAKVIVVGVLVIDRAVDKELFNTQIASVKVYGKLQVPKHLSGIIAEKQMQ